MTLYCRIGLGCKALKASRCRDRGSGHLGGRGWFSSFGAFGAEGEKVEGLRVESAGMAGDLGYSRP